jgi:type II secretory pathway component PulF
MWQSFHPGRFTTVFGRGVRDRFVWATPVLHGIARDRGLADAYEFIADALRNGATLDRALAEAAQLEINNVLRDRLERWADAVQGGAGLTEGARVSQMPRLVVGMLATVRGVEAAADAFRFLARYYHSRYSRVAALLYGAAVPITVFFFGALVLTVAMAMFAPLVTLINSLSNDITGVL